jgi:hypothetical protein
LYDQTCCKISSSSRMRVDIKCCTSLRAPQIDSQGLFALSLSIAFQNVILETAQNGTRFCAYRHSTVLRSIINTTRSMQGTNPQTHARPSCQYIAIKARGPRSTYLSISTTFYTCIVTYKKKGLPIDVPLSSYYFLHAHRHVQKVRGSRLTYLSAPTTFYTCIAAYKMQRAPDQCIIMLFIHDYHHI